MSRVISLRLKSHEVVKLERLGRLLGRSLGETAVLLLGEKLREEEFPFIEFRHSPAGRQAYVKGTGLTVWEVVLVARGLDMDPRRVAAHLELPEEQVRSALVYAEAYPGEIDPIVDAVQSFTFDDLRRRIPWAREVRI